MSEDYDWRTEDLGRVLARIIMKEFEHENRRKDFEQWYRKTYGKDYVWKKGVLKCTQI